MRLERLRLQLGMELHADEPGVVVSLDDLGQRAVRRHADEAEPCALQRVAIVDVKTIVLAVVSGILLLVFRVNSVWLVLGGAVVGWMLR